MQARPSEHDARLFAVTSCMGRLRFLRHTLPRVLADPGVRYCLVDYSCPDRASNWVEQACRSVRDRIAIEYVAGQKVFNKSRALNIGARRALRDGAEYLCFLDADTLVDPKFWDFVRSEMCSDRFLVAGRDSDGSPVPSLTGVLVVHGAVFERAGGFDEAFTGWGAEDLELRLRLHLVEGLDFVDIPLSLVRPIPHSNSLRVRFHEDRDIFRSNRRNIERILHKLRTEWVGRSGRVLSSARDLVFPGTTLYDALGARPLGEAPSALVHVQEDRRT